MSNEPHQEKRHWGRTVAEWTTLAVCFLIVAGMAGYLVYQETKQEDRIIVAQVRPQFGELERKDGVFVLPVVVRNPGERTLRHVKVTAGYVDEKGQPQTKDHTVDYLGERSSKTIYFYFKEDPRELGVELQAEVYSLE